eukprot:m.13238 g.13238  ORF g.13238 m.13238 type:complete len:340 (+) comp5922_c0_seq1:116-1135(+)
MATAPDATAPNATTATSSLDLSCVLGGIALPTCVYNASGPKCTTVADLEALARSRSAAVVCKSCTLAPREGNPLPRYYESEQLQATTNSTGLANLGFEFYQDAGPTIHAIAPSKPYIVSVAGMCADDNVEMLTRLWDASTKRDFQAVELNLSCPNIVGKPQVGYDLEATDKLLARVAQLYQDVEQPLGLKLPPYFDPVMAQGMANIITKFDVKFVTCINSVGNGLIVDVDTESTVIKPKGGLGGIGGLAIKPFALSNVRMMRGFLPDTIDVVGCGGIQSGRDAFEHFLVGATAVQVGSQVMMEGPECIGRIQDELAELMKSKGYTSLDQFRGKLKTDNF